jgi:CHAT domain-containing protein
VRQRQDLLGRRRAADTQLTDMLMGRADDIGEDGKNALRRAIAGLDQTLDAIEARLGSEFPEYAALAHPEPLSIAATQDLLGEHEVLVQFIETRKWLKDDRTPPEEAFAWFISKREVRWIKIPFGPEALAEKVRVLRCGLDTSAWEVDGSRCSELWPEWRSETNRKLRSWLPFDTQRAHELYRILFAGSEDLIQGKQLLVVPSPSLGNLPFHVLVAAQPAEAIPAEAGVYRKVAWLAYRNPITVLPSVASLKALRQFAKTSHATNPFIGFGNPLLKGVDGNDLRAWARQTCAQAPGRLAASITASTINRSAHTFFRGGLADVAALRNQPPLPETTDELCAVAQLTGAQPTAVYLGEQATERTVKELSAGGRLATYRVIHFATHGLLAGETERFAQSKAEPALLLSPPEVATDEDDGLLTASEVAQLHLDSDWVVLSACNTAAGSIGEERNVEALSDLARAFFYAGARALLVSHWYVDSNAAVHSITRTFAAMKVSPTVGRAEALRRSMATLIATGGLNAHPMHWAPFVVVGEGGASMPTAHAQKASAPHSQRGEHVMETSNPRIRATKMFARRSKAIDWRSEIWGR